MFVQSKFTDTKTRSNKRTPSKKGVKYFRPATGRTKSSGSIGLSPSYGRRKNNGTQSKLKFPSITPWKVILISFLIGIFGILYINHVFSTQRTLQEVQQLESEFNKIKRIHSEKRLEFDRMIGPKEIYQKAQEQGFINPGPADKVLILNK
ncbi:MAG: hypothetical protein WD035_01505 [Balneolaceae bacterium]